MDNIYNIEVTKKDGKKIKMEKYRGKIILIVNTASKCGFSSQFKELEDLYQKYKDKDFIILGFPCSQFKNQEFDTAQKAENYCQINYGVSFEIMDKIDVKGENQSELFKYLKEQQKGLLYNEIKWNFTKFLINSEGEVIKRYAPITSPKVIERTIKKIIKQ